MELPHRRKRTGGGPGTADDSTFGGLGTGSESLVIDHECDTA